MERRTLLALALLVAGGCYESRNPDGGPDGGPLPPPPPPTELDLLFVVDNSSSMGEEQASLAAALPALLSELATHYESIHAGVITTDMGVGGSLVPTCANADFGDDGLLRTQGNTALAGCAETYPRFFEWDAESAPAPSFAGDLACVASSLGGCGYEQQLEAVLKALTPTVAQPWTSPFFAPVGTAGAPDGIDVPFYRESMPHGNAANEGFLRADSMLGIVTVTDEEDCSALDPDLYDPSSEVYGDLALRCFAHPDALHPVARYVRGLLQLRRDPTNLTYFVIAGVPADLAPGPGEAASWEMLVSPDLALRDIRMQERVDPEQPTRLLPSCSLPGRGVAFPPVRIVQAAEHLERHGARAGVGSICRESFSDSFASLVTLLTP